MTRVGVLVLSILVAGAGCTMSASSRRTAIAGGAALGVGGILVMRSGANDSDGDGMNELWLNDDLGAYLGGTVMLLAGTALLLGALASREPSEPPRVLAATPPPPEAPPAEPEQPASRGVVIERVPALPLPDLPTSREAELLARKLRSAATHRHCEVAWIMWADLEKLDPIYARAVRDGPVMARCAE